MAGFAGAMDMEHPPLGSETFHPGAVGPEHHGCGPPCATGLGAGVSTLGSVVVAGVVVGAGGATHAWVPVFHAPGAKQRASRHGPAACTPVTLGHTSTTGGTKTSQCCVPTFQVLGAMQSVFRQTTFCA